MMVELSRYLFLAGACPFVLLGAAHALLTPQAADDRTGLSPSDPKLAESMARATLRLTPRTDMWRAWVGFNLSHGLGCLVFGGLILLGGRSQASFAAEGPLFLPFAVVVSAAYLVLALKYWFRTPIIGCGVSLACLLASWITFGLRP